MWLNCMKSSQRSASRSLAEDVSTGRESGHLKGTFPLPQGGLNQDGFLKPWSISRERRIARFEPLMSRPVARPCVFLGFKRTNKHVMTRAWQWDNRPRTYAGNRISYRVGRSSTLISSRQMELLKVRHIPDNHQAVGSSAPLQNDSLFSFC